MSLRVPPRKSWGHLKRQSLPQSRIPNSELVAEQRIQEEQHPTGRGTKHPVHITHPVDNVYSKAYSCQHLLYFLVKPKSTVAKIARDLHKLFASLTTKEKDQKLSNAPNYG